MINLTNSPPLSLYIHYPWCIKKCPYCDFNSHVNPDKDDFRYVEALINDLKNELPKIWGRPIYSIFFGGGTPSLISVEALDYLFSELRALLHLSPQIEITLEANPGATDRDKLKKFKEIGINRLSIGVQSFNDQYLQNLGRIHTAKEAHQTIESAQNAGFENLNIDLMYGLPNQTIESALFDIDQALKHQSNHLSYYQLTIEPNTPFYHSPPTIPDEDNNYEIQLACYEKLKSAGYSRYEISAWSDSASIKNHCKHNINYWSFGDYLGIGAGAHSKISNSSTQTITRTVKLRHPKDYIKATKSSHKNNFVLQENTLSKKDLVFEFMLNNSRLINGFNLSLFSETTGLLPKDLTPYLEKAIQQGYLINYNDKIIPTKQGINFLNDLQMIFLEN